MLPVRRVVWALGSQFIYAGVKAAIEPVNYGRRVCIDCDVDTNGYPAGQDVRAIPRCRVNQLPTTHLEPLSDFGRGF